MYPGELLLKALDLHRRSKSAFQDHVSHLQVRERSPLTTRHSAWQCFPIVGYPRLRTCCDLHRCGQPSVERLSLSIPSFQEQQHFKEKHCSSKSIHLYYSSPINIPLSSNLFIHPASSQRQASSYHSVTFRNFFILYLVCDEVNIKPSPRDATTGEAPTLVLQSDHMSPVVAAQDQMST